ncbi:MAG TPA: DUF6298 domain-containing protein [Verrucomicrobiae bacterium]|nr:DUF6298 domain-containing protein [Verrucomicrobiae bacterium]
MRMKIFCGFVVGWAVFAMVGGSFAATATGPLRVSGENPRYFADASGKVVYLTGLHTWSNLQDQGASEPPPKFDYGKYLEDLRRYNHNFIRLWAWEQARWAPWSDGKNGNPKDWYVEPNPYRRTGPGEALDGKAKFDLEKFDEAYFSRLRERVRQAGEQGIYVSIMLFQGWSSAKGWLGGKPWDGHPYNPKNNIQGFNGNPSGNSGPALDLAAVRDRQAKYVRKVVDKVNDLDNVLYEVTNEGGYKEWDWWVVETVQAYEKGKAKQHPVGLTAHGAESNDEMLASRADWFSPGSKDWPDLTGEPRAADGKKPSLVDTDHVWGVGGSPQWVWKTFMRGHNVIFMDPYDDPQWAPILAREGVRVADLEGTRRAMGQTRMFSERINLARAHPVTDVASTGFCLANAGVEYLIYQPKSGEAFTVKLPEGTFRYEWSKLDGSLAGSGETKSTGDVVSFRAPFSGEAVLLLKR